MPETTEADENEPDRAKSKCAGGAGAFQDASKPAAKSTNTTDLKPLRARGREKQDRRAAVNPTLPQNKVDTSWHEKYLELLEINGGQKTAACRGCNVTMATLANHRNAMPEFAAAELLALKMAMDICEDEARRRAIDGTTSTVTTTLKDGSVRTYTKTKYSDTILLRLLEKNETGFWRQKQQIEHSSVMGFKTEAERKAALEKARAIRDGTPEPVEAINSRSEMGDPDNSSQVETASAKPLHKNPGWQESGAKSVLAEREKFGGYTISEVGPDR